MKKSLIILVLLIVYSLNIHVVYSSMRNVDPDKEVELVSKKPRPTKSLSPTPDVKAYLNDDYLEIVFNEAVAGDVTVIITENGHEAIYSETLPVNSPMIWPVFIDFDENSSYQLEILTKDWYLYGEF